MFLKASFSISGHIILVPKESAVFPHIFGNKLRDSAPLASKLPTPKGRAYMRAQPLDRVLTSRHLPPSLKLPSKYPHLTQISSRPSLKLPSKYPHLAQISSPPNLKLPPKYPHLAQISSPPDLKLPPKYPHLAQISSLPNLKLSSKYPHPRH